MDTALIVAAIAPAIVLVIVLYHSDTADKEPLKLVCACFVLGMVATIPIMVLEMAADTMLSSVFDPESMTYLVVESVLGVALIEELFKLFAAMIPTWKSNSFNYVFDGVLYCAVAALGYACLENIIYVYEGGFETAMVRAVVSVPSHMVDGIFMGIFVGYAKLHKYRGSTGKMWGCLLLALVIPIAEHGAFDGLAALEEATQTGMAIFALLVLIAVEYVAAIVIVVKRRGKNDILIFEAATPAPPAVSDTPAASAAPLGSDERPRPRFCRECGSQLHPDGGFCPSCGARIAD